MDKIRIMLQDYLWVILIFLVISIGANIYFTIQPIGLVLVLTGLMLILAMENSDMIHAVTETQIQDKWYRTLFVHFHTQKSIARFIYYYHLYIYSYLIVFITVLFVIGSDSMIRYSNIINIIILICFGIAAITIFIRRILVGAKYEH